jgi:hypothetical protein
MRKQCELLNAQFLFVDKQINQLLYILFVPEHFLKSGATKNTVDITDGKLC